MKGGSAAHLEGDEARIGLATGVEFAPARADAGELNSKEAVGTTGGEQGGTAAELDGTPEPATG